MVSQNQETLELPMDDTCIYLQNLYREAEGLAERLAERLQGMKRGAEKKRITRLFRRAKDREDRRFRAYVAYRLKGAMAGVINR